MQKGHQGGPSEAFEYDERLCDANIRDVLQGDTKVRLRTVFVRCKEDNGGRWFKL